MYWEEENSEKKSASSSMSDLARRILLTGVGAIFMTEGSVRKTLAELKIPKDAITSLIELIRKQKNELLQLVATEVTSFFSKIKVHEEIQKAMQGMQIHVDAHISFSPKSGEKTTTRIQVKRRK